MAKKKKFYEEELPENSIMEDLPIKKEIMFTSSTKEYVKKLIPSHWAREEGMDEALFLYYDKDGACTREEYERIKKLVS